MIGLAVLLGLLAMPAGAGALGDRQAAALVGADVAVLGEVHDNPVHHRNQGDMLRLIAPRAVVWEMLTEDQAQLVDAEAIADLPALRAALDWDNSGWPDFALYAPVFQAAGDARAYGALVPRAALRGALKTGPVGVFGDAAGAFGLTDPLPSGQLAARTSLQFEVHCRAMPPETLEPMVMIQRVRDAALARAALRALDDVGPPVAIITGNGHARPDWGVPSYLLRLRPDLRVVAVGQSEAGAPMAGGFDIVLDAPQVQRPDPCAGFR